MYMNMYVYVCMAVSLKSDRSIEGSIPLMVQPVESTKAIYHTRLSINSLVRD